eukprot:9721290-Alexandrium_andersonii.AAC.1
MVASSTDDGAPAHQADDQRAPAPTAQAVTLAVSAQVPGSSQNGAQPGPGNPPTSSGAPGAQGAGPRAGAKEK